MKNQIIVNRYIYYGLWAVVIIGSINFALRWLLK